MRVGNELFALLAFVYFQSSKRAPSDRHMAHVYVYLCMNRTRTYFPVSAATATDAAAVGVYTQKSMNEIGGAWEESMKISPLYVFRTRYVSLRQTCMHVQIRACIRVFNNALPLLRLMLVAVKNLRCCESFVFVLLLYRKVERKKMKIRTKKKWMGWVGMNEARIWYQKYIVKTRERQNLNEKERDRDRMRR